MNNIQIKHDLIFVTYETGFSQTMPKIINLFWHIKFDFFSKMKGVPLLTFRRLL